MAGLRLPLFAINYECLEMVKFSAIMNFWVYQIEFNLDLIIRNWIKLYSVESCLVL